MSFIVNARMLLVGAGILAITVSLALNASFARDETPPAVPEPATATLLGIAGAAGIATGLIRRRKR